jgi:hypothetical protein
LTTQRLLKIMQSIATRNPKEQALINVLSAEITERANMALRMERIIHESVKTLEALDAHNITAI